MFTPFKGRTLSVGDRVFVYRNLHADKWSLKAETGAHAGKVVGHATSVALSGAEFRVSEAGRQRVIRDKRKNVHAGVSGVFVGDVLGDNVLPTRVRYNPYAAGTFTVGYANAVPIFSAAQVELDSTGRVYV